MKYSDIKLWDVINGEGVRVSIFVSGCEHKCKGCFNPETWDCNYGSEWTPEIEDKILDYIDKYSITIRGLSVLGGDPTYPSNVSVLSKFFDKFNKRFPDKTIWIWSGYRIEEIVKDKDMLDMIKKCDVLVDGRYMEQLKDLNLLFRGSSNQRIIEIKKYLETGKI